MERLFKLKTYNTSVGTEILAGFTTFFAMSYILFVNPEVLSLTGMPSQAVFLATIIASAVGTLVMGLFANVPYALAPGWGSTPSLHTPSSLPSAIPGNRRWPSSSFVV